MRLLVSACLLGLCTRYDGRAKADARVMDLAGRHILVPVCPEQLGGLPTPRAASEIRDGRVVSCLGEDVTEAFIRGAEEALKVCRIAGCEAAVLKARSPSCGKGQVYDGRFTETLREGSGLFAARLLDEGIPVFTEEETGQIGC